jgi:hypothetical protein
MSITPLYLINLAIAIAGWWLVQRFASGPLFKRALISLVIAISIAPSAVPLHNTLLVFPAINLLGISNLGGRDILLFCCAPIASATILILGVWSLAASLQRKKNAA